jgi:hypothetical protein
VGWRCGSSPFGTRSPLDLISRRRVRFMPAAAVSNSQQGRLLIRSPHRRAPLVAPQFSSV